MRSDASVTLPSSRGRRSGWRLDVPVCMAGLLCLAAAVTLGACASGSPSPRAASPVPITDFGMVAGRWEGTAKGLASARQDDDWIKLTIGKDGAYDFGIYRTIGVFGGKGQATITDGKLQMEGERGRATYVLYEGDGRRYLRGDGVLHSGGTVSVELRPAR